MMTITVTISGNDMALAIDIDYARVNILTRSVKIGGLTVKPDTNVPDFSIAIDKVKISGIGLFRILSGEGVHIGKILLDEAVFKGNFEHVANHFFIFNH